MDIIINLKFFSFTRSISINRRWLQIGIVIAVLLASVMISFWGSTNIFFVFLVLFGGIAFLFGILRQPNIGFLFLIAGGMLIPMRGPSGLSIATVMVALMLGLWIMDMFIVKRNVQFIRSFAMLPVVVFLVISVLAFIVGQIPWFVFARQAPLDAQVGGFSIFIFSIGGLLLSAHLIKDVHWLKIIVWTFIGLSTIYVIARAANLSVVANLFHLGYTAQSMFWTWLVTLAFSQVLFNSMLKRQVRWFLIGLVLLVLFVGIFQMYTWKSGWVPPAIAAAVLIGLRYRKLIIFAIPFVVVATLYLVMDLIGAEDYSWGTRVDAWRIVLEIGRVSPLLGMGFANYYWYTPLFPIRGWRVSFNSHSQFVDLIAETGYIGMLAFLWVFFEIGRLCWRLAKHFPEGFERAYIYGVLAGVIASIVASLLGDWVLPFVYNVGLAGFRSGILPWIFMGGVIALEQIHLRSSQYQESG